MKGKSMNKLLIVVTSLLCALNGQINYNEWSELHDLSPVEAVLYMCSQISGQDNALRYAKNMTSKIFEASDSTKRKLNDIYAMPDNEVIVGELFLITIEWIKKRPQLWSLDIQDLCLYARLDIYGDDETKKYVKAKILKALSTKL
jgi:hypothetical protein